MNVLQTIKILFGIFTLFVFIIITDLFRPNPNLSLRHLLGSFRCPYNTVLHETHLIPTISSLTAFNVKLTARLEDRQVVTEVKISGFWIFVDVGAIEPMSNGNRGLGLWSVERGWLLV
jgi:hypothetical protein